MRLTINFGKTEKPSILGIQRFIYSCLKSSDEKYAKSVHDTGIVFKKNSFTKNIKPFVFSHPYFTSHGDCCVKLSSSNPGFIFHFAAGSAKRETDLAYVDIKSSQMPDLCFNENGNTSREMFMLSPLVVKDKGGKYLTDWTNENFQRIIRENLIDKYTALKGVVPKNTFCKLEFGKDVTTKAKIYKGEKIDCLLDRFKFSVSEELFEAAYEAGIGQKNAVGFGLIELADE